LLALGAASLVGVIKSLAFLIPTLFFGGLCFVAYRVAKNAVDKQVKIIIDRNDESIGVTKESPSNVEKNRYPIEELKISGGRVAFQGENRLPEYRASASIRWDTIYTFDPKDLDDCKSMLSAFVQFFKLNAETLPIDFDEDMSRKEFWWYSYKDKRFVDYDVVSKMYDEIAASAE
jgi:hypothetical protein